METIQNQLNSCCYSTVLLDPLLERLKNQEKDVKVTRVHRMDEGEHCDMFWHADAVELVFHLILGML